MREPIIHGLNKDETAIAKYPFYDIIRNRTNALVLGDSPGDISMLHGSNVVNSLKIGFLNDSDTNKQQYVEAYDAVMLNDQDMEYINDLLKKMF